MTPETTPEERHRRRLAGFCRWLLAYLEHDHAGQRGMASLAEAATRPGCPREDRDAAIDTLDRWLLGDTP